MGGGGGGGGRGRFCHKSDRVVVKDDTRNLTSECGLN